MIRNLLVVLVVLLFVSCEKKSQTPQEMILGNWVEVKKKTKGEEDLPPPPGNDTLGYEFKGNGICEFKHGYFDYEKFYNDTSSQRIVPYLGTETKYIIRHKKLNIYNPISKQWDEYRIKKITPDSLVIDNGSEILFAKKQYDTLNAPDFDTVILSSSPCYGSCPVNNIMIDANGNVAYQGLFHVKNIGFYWGKIKAKEFNSIMKQFKSSDYIHLKSGYFATHTDDRTVYVTFVKNGKIVKAITDYGSDAPKEFVWAYEPLIFKAQNIKFTPQKSPQFLNTDFNKIVFPKQNLYLFESEFFYLLSKFRSGIEIDTQFEEKYEMYYYNKLVEKVKTDGRNYKFYLKDGTTHTIDIGFDFLTANENNKELNDEQNN